MSVTTDLFKQTKEVLKQYHQQQGELILQREELNTELAGLQEEMTALLLDMESAGASERVYLKLRAKEITSKLEIIEKIKEELKEEMTELRLRFTPHLKQALVNDRQGKKDYNATAIVEKYKYLMLAEIAELGKEMNKQYNAIAPEVLEVFDDEAVKAEYRTIYHAFNQDQYKPVLSWAGDIVIDKNEVALAGDGRLPKGLVKPQ